MRKDHFLISNPFAVALVLIIMFLSGEYSRGRSDPKSARASSIPDDLHKIFEKSCMGCHARGGNLMAMFHLNFTKWDDYRQEKQVSLAADICKMLSKGEMPPKSARQSHPELIPSNDQIKSICTWSDSLKQNLKK